MRQGKGLALGVLLQLGGRVAKILAGVVALGVAARILPGGSGDQASELGQYVLVIAFVFLFASIAAFGVDNIVIRELARHDADPALQGRIVRVATSAKLLLSLVSTAGALVAAVLLQYDATLLQAIAIFSPYIILSAFGSSGLFGDVLQAAHRSRPIAVAGTLSAVFTFLATGVAAILHGGVIAFLAVYLVAGVVDVAITYVGARRVMRLGIAWDSQLAGELLREAFPLGVATFFFLLYVRVDTILLQKLTQDGHQVALYGIAYKLFDVLSTIVTTILLVVFPVMTRAYERGREALGALYRQIFTLMMALSLPLGFAIFLLRGPIITLVASRANAAAQLAVPGLMIATSCIFPSAVASYMLVVTRQQRWNLLLAVSATIVNVAFNLWLIPQYGFVAASWTTAVTEGFVLLYNILMVALLAHFWPFTRATLFVLVGALAFGLAFVPGIPPIAGGAVGLVVYGAILFAAGILRPATARRLLSRQAASEAEGSLPQSSAAIAPEMTSAGSIVGNGQLASAEAFAASLAFEPFEPTLPRMPVVDRAIAARSPRPREEQLPVSRPSPETTVNRPDRTGQSHRPYTTPGPDRGGQDHHPDAPAPFPRWVLVMMAIAVLLGIAAPLLPHGAEIAAGFVFLALAVVVAFRPKWALFIFIVGLPLHNLLMSLVLETTNSVAFTRLMQPWKEVLLAIAFVRIVAPAALDWWRTRRVRLTALDVALLVFIGLCAVSVVLPSHYIPFSGRIYGFRLLVVPLSLFFLGRLVRFEERDYRTIVSLLAFDVALMVLGQVGERLFWGIGLYQAVGYERYLLQFYPGNTSPFLPQHAPFSFYTGHPFWLPRAGSFALNPIDATTLIMLALPVVLAVTSIMLQQRQRSLGQILPLALVALLGGVGIALGLTRATIILLPVVLILLFLRGKFRSHLPGTGLTLVGFGAGAFLLLVSVALIIQVPEADAAMNNLRVARANQGLFSLLALPTSGTNSNPLGAIVGPATNNNPSTTGHVTTTAEVIKLMLKRPIGYGIGYSGEEGVRSGTAVAAEGSYVNIGADLGIFGLLLYFGVFLGAIFTTWQAARSRLSPLRRALFFGLAIAWIAIFIDGFIAQVTLNLFIMFVLWWLTGLATSEIQRSRVAAVHAPNGDLLRYEAPHPLRVAIDVQCLQTARTGVRTYIDALLREFRFSGPDYRIVLLAGPRRLPSTNKIFRMINQAMYLPWLYLWLPARLAIGNFDVLFSPEYSTPIWAPCARVITFHDAVFYRRPEDYNKLWLASFKGITVPAIRRADAVLAPSQASAREIIAYARIPAEIMHVTPLAPSDPGPMARDTPHATRTLARFGVTPFNYILHVGVLEKRKNLVTLIQAFDVWRKQGAPAGFKLVLVGQPGPRPALDDSAAIRAEIDARGLRDVVVLTGHLAVADRNDFFTHAAVIAVPSLLEGFGIPVLDGFAAGVPVVAARSSSLPEVAGGAALYFDPQRPEELASRFQELAADPALRSRLVEAGRARLAEYSWHRTAQETLRAFEAAAVHAFAPASGRAAPVPPGAPPTNYEDSFPGLDETRKRRVATI